MQMESQRNIAQQRLKPLLRRWWSLTVQHLKGFPSQAFQDPSAQAPVIAKEMREFVGYRKPLFVIAIGPIYKSQAMATPCHETRPQGPIFSRQFTHQPGVS
jgi:hypothetical protein